MTKSCKISVAIATYNGEKYIRNQLTSILSQLKEYDEIVVSDNYSTDDTLNIIHSLKDNRIKILNNKPVSISPVENCIQNFENALSHCTGDIIFLSDQDDIWKDTKVAICLHYLEKYDVLVSDCSLIDNKFNVILDSYFSRRLSGSGFWKNLYKNTYLGCCMVFKKRVLQFALPFPKKIPMHDIYIGTIADLFFKSYFIPESLVLYRDHGTNVSNTTSGISSFGMWRQLSFRLNVLKYIPILYYRKLFR